MAKEKTSKEPAKASAKTPAPSAPASFFPLNTLRDDIDRAFDRMFKDWPRFGAMTMPDFFGGSDFFGKTTAAAPRVDVTEDDKGYEITAEMPGVAEKDVEVSVRDDRLTLRGEKKSETEEKKKDYHMTERSYGSFERSFRLPGDVDADNIKADFTNGVLTLTLPKTAESKTKERKIAIKAK
jgi:HSP20 family protein